MNAVLWLATLLTIYLTIRLWVRDFYLNNRVFLSRNYRLITAPRKFDVVKTNVCLEKRSFEGKYAGFKNIKFPRGSYQTDSSETIFFRAPVQKLDGIIFSFFRWKPWKLNVKFEKENRQKPTWFSFNCLFSISPLVYRDIFTDDYYPSGYFPRTGTVGW